ncbi:transcription factor RelB homolog isoform X1 [Dunckerocampus dactyliophorus]|uniref:transcription factor RelB homolog isoform X1 n=2 Tax=Dunckerocampus dactyliophorus TaxID=161453 RepID=UPI00240542FF|nr:transcription factor RelB homolog isoform X1 [Dunckerocampus dactyliophorus]
MDVFNRTPERGLSDFDLIQEIITEAVSLPRPPPPPADLCNQNHRMLHQSPSSPPSQRVLVGRGTACQSSCTFTQPLQQLCSSQDMSHPPPSSAHHHHHHQAGSPRRGRACRMTSKTASTISSMGRRGEAEMLERVLEKPKLVVVEQPKERGMRFRYECEGRSAGSILGASGTESNKTQPAIEIEGPVDHLKKVTVTVSLVTKDPPHRPHPHCLVGKDCPNRSGICVVTLNPQSNRRHSFANLGIQCVRRKELDVSLQKRRSQNIDPFQTGHSKGIEDMDMNAVRLCFQCELEWEDGTKDSLSPVVSNPIYDKKATTTSQLKISQLNQYRGPCTGKTEIYMLCDKVQKDDIEIIFRRGSWKANGEFAQTDVHRQIAIVFKTPPYQDQDIIEEVDVSVTLRRLSDQMESEPVNFTYLPYNSDPYEVKRKRKIKSDISFQEKANVTAEGAASTSAPEQTFHFPHAVMSPSERPCSAQPGPSTLGEMCYTESQDSNMDTDDLALINQLLELPVFMDMLSDEAITSAIPSGFDQGPDGSQAFFANMDANRNQNFGLYTQDFSHYADLQFNMLVNENRNLQPPETQASPSNMVQVKIEDDL